MAKFRTLLVIGFCAASATAYADDDSHSGRLVTGTLWAQAPVNFACNLTNIGDKARTATTRIVNGSNGAELLAKTAKLAPRTTMDTTVEGLPAPGGPLYCDFTFRGSKKNFRGTAKLWAGPAAPNASDITAITAE